MLVLSRKTNEAITIGNDVKVIILGVRGDTVKLGIKAPQSIEVHREEVYEAIQKEKE